MQWPTGYKVRRRKRFVGYEEWESALFEMKSNKKALFEMKSDEKPLSDEELKALFEMKMVAKNTPKQGLPLNPNWSTRTEFTLTSHC